MTSLKAGSLLTNRPVQAGSMGFLPASWVPYAELLRLDRLGGLSYFYLPYVFGVLYAALTTEPVMSPTELLILISVLFVATFMLRGAAVSWNDIADRDVDRQVRRTCMRPIARGAVSPRDAYLLAGLHVIAFLGLMSFFDMRAILAAAFYIILHACYPLSKRVTDYTPVVLGFTFAWDIIASSTTIRPDRATLWSDDIAFSKAGLYALYGSHVCWTIVYEGIYAHQDLKDDIKAGVRSMAVRHMGSFKTILSACATVQVCLLGVTGWLISAGLAYYLGACCGTAACLILMIREVDLMQPSDCLWWFKTQGWLIGGCIAAGLAGEYVHRWLGT